MKGLGGALHMKLHAVGLRRACHSQLWRDRTCVPPPQKGTWSELPCRVAGINADITWCTFTAVSELLSCHVLHVYLQGECVAELALAHTGWAHQLGDSSWWHADAQRIVKGLGQTQTMKPVQQTNKHAQTARLPSTWLKCVKGGC